MIGDNDPDIQFRENSQIDAAIKLVLNLGKVVGDQTTVDNYTYSGGNTSPDLTSTEDPKAFAQLVYYAARQFIVDISPTSWRTRAFSESIGENREKIWALLEDIWNLENGDGCASSDYE